MFRPKTEGYSGAESYKYIDELLEGGGRYLKIITPYISDFYAQRLIKLARRKRVYLLLSGAERAEEEAVKMLLKKGRSANFKLIFWTLLVAAGLLYLHFYTVGAVVLLFAVFILYYGLVHRPAGTKLFVKIATDKFIHEKLYIAEERAIIGSANLTYSGTHKNIEHIEIINEPRRIDELSSHFDGLWAKY